MILDPSFLFQRKKLAILCIVFATILVWVLYLINGDPERPFVFGASLVRFVASGQTAIYLGAFLYGSVLGLGLTLKQKRRVN